jgi:uncharacterized membrane protein YfcA
LRGRETQRIALLLIAAAVAGTPVGVLVNAQVSGGAFGILLGLCVGAIGVLLFLREHQRRGAAASGPLPVHRPPAAALVLVLGFAVASVSGLFGLGGQLLSVPLLISIGAPMLPALGAAQAQSIVITSVGTIGYALRDAIAWPLVVVVGVPLLAGALAGWRIANAVPIERLRSLLAVALIAVGAYLILHNA